jgi:hypothetical protein
MKRTFTLFVLILCLAASAHGQQQTKGKSTWFAGAPATTRPTSAWNSKWPSGRVRAIS